MKQLSFTGNSIDISCHVSLKDETDLSENFFIRNVRGIRSRGDIKRFYFLHSGLPITMNELVFITLSHDTVVLEVRNEDGEILVSYGNDVSVNNFITEDDKFLVTEDGQFIETEDSQ